MDALISLSSELQEAAAWVCWVLGQQVRPHPSAGAQVASRHYSLIFRDKNKTLSDEEINKTMEEIISELEKTSGAKLR